LLVAAIFCAVLVDVAMAATVAPPDVLG